MLFSRACNILQQRKFYQSYKKKTGDLKFFHDKNSAINISLFFSFSIINPFKCQLNNQKFLFYTLSNDLTTCAFRLLSMTLSNKMYSKIKLFLGGSNGCVYKENIFYSSAKISPITAMANENADCFVILLLASNYEITNLWTTSVKQNVKI